MQVMVKTFTECPLGRPLKCDSRLTSQGTSESLGVWLTRGTAMENTFYNSRFMFY